MSDPTLKQLPRAEELFNAGKLDEALEILNDWSQFEGLNSQQKENFLFLKGLILIYQNKAEELISIGEYIFKEGQKLNRKHQSFDGLFFIIIGLCLANKYDETVKLIDDAEDLLKQISIQSEINLTQKIIRLKLLKAWNNILLGNLNLTEKYLEQSLHLQNEDDNSFEMVWVNLLMAQVMFQSYAKYDLAMKYTKKAIKMAKKIRFNHYWLGFCHISLGVNYLSIYETEIGLKHHMKSLAIFQEINNNWYIAVLLSNIGIVYCNKGEYDLALKYLEKSLILWEQYPFRLESCLYNLVFITLEKGDDELAQKYFHRLENMYNQKKGVHIELFYKYLKALMLKRSTRIRDKAKAEELLKQIIETEAIYLEVTRDALVCLCDLLLSEFRISKNNEVFDEINVYISKLVNIAEKTHSFQVFCETFILQAKLSLLNFKTKEAQRFLTQAQKIAEKYGIKRLAMKISYEHDELIKQLKVWEKLKESDADLSERWKLAGLNEQMETMVKKLKTDVPEHEDEEPVLLLIVSEGGVPFFSQSFMENKKIEDHLFGGFFTAINSFINEIFSEGLDRASFGNYTLLMNSISPFLMCYVYKGQSYSAQKRIKSFINEIKNKKELWNTFKKFYLRNQKIQMKDIPSLEPLIKKIFLKVTNH
ncbi:MAG: tetratricopeptide repeat protein [Candidatus Thorarchaeota archaeon]